MNEPIKQMLALQEKDLALDKLRAETVAIPGKMDKINAEIQATKKALEDAKKDLTTLQMSKKQKDMDLETQENSIRKYTTDLNLIKSNDAYKALLGEIDKAKRDKSGLEDQILLVMDQIDQASRTWKEKEVSSKTVEADLQKQISDLVAKKAALEQETASKQTEREEAGKVLPAKLSEHYERLRKNKKGAAVVPLRKGQCSGCHMAISQNLLNEVRRGQKIMTCEHCERIVFLEETLSAAAPGPQV